MTWFKEHVCHKCGYSTMQIGHYNRHRQKVVPCKHKEIDCCPHCQKPFAKKGSGLRKHTCLANGMLPFNMDLSADKRKSVRLALHELQKLSKYHLKKLGFVDLDPVKVAVAAIKYLHFTPTLAQSQNITWCQYDASKFDIVQRCDNNLVWIPQSKYDVLPVLLDEAVDVIEGLVNFAHEKLPKHQVEPLKSFVRHVLRPCWKSGPSEVYGHLAARHNGCWRPELGKVKLLESLSGIGLPRGGNLVTRCPLQLELRQGQTESAVLSYTDPADIARQITKTVQLADIPDAVNAATEHLAGKNSGLVPALISLRVTKPEAPDLTLIDLPGIVRNPIGDQPQDIEQQIRDLIYKHIEGGGAILAQQASMIHLLVSLDRIIALMLAAAELLGL